MIVRLVKMQFRDSEVTTFLRLFDERKEQIRNFEGCRHLELWQDSEDQTIFFTYSIWAEASFLEQYRKSSFFKETWGLTKVLFRQRPEAWSINRLDQLP